jgi:dTDP-4-amino-4,6-dideoxygalactose transaminase
MTAMAIKIPYVNIAAQHASIKGELLEAIAGVLDRGQFILAKEVSEFERRFAQLCGVRFAVAVKSGTDALILALRALGIGPRDEVITVPNSFVASTSCIKLVGAEAVFVDVCEDYNMDPALLKKAITPRTKAILPVHLTGRPANMDPIMEVASKHGLYVVEDCAQAVLAEYRGRRVGSFGTIGCFSLHPLKTLNACGDGGVLTTNSETTYEQLGVLRNIGLRTRDECVVWSGNSRLDTLQAAILLTKMKYLETWTERRRANAAFYQKMLGDLPGLRVPVDQGYEKAVYHTFVVQAEQRDALRGFLVDHGVETAIHYPVPIHFQKAAAALGYGPGSFPVAEQQAQCILSLPVYPELGHEDLEYVAGTIREFYCEYR